MSPDVAFDERYVERRAAIAMARESECDDPFRSHVTYRAGRRGCVVVRAKAERRIRFIARTYKG